jgi:hypothetical protein
LQAEVARPRWTTRLSQDGGGGAAGIVAGAKPGYGDMNQDRDHQVVPSDLTLRSKRSSPAGRQRLSIAAPSHRRRIRTKIGPRNGARVVARVGRPAYKKRLLADASPRWRSLASSSSGRDIVALENTAKIHNLVVCTRARATRMLSAFHRCV